MNQRDRKADVVDDFPTPPWATRALCKYVIHGELRGSVCEPASGRGFMTRALIEYFDEITMFDKYEYAGCHHQQDYLTASIDNADWTITNPPFALAEEFALKALRHSEVGVALLCRSNFAESAGRYRRLFKPYPPTVIAQFVERVPMVRGRCDPKASTATAYAWFVWLQFWREPTKFVWLPPCRAELERDGDYDLF